MRKVIGLLLVAIVFVGTALVSAQPPAGKKEGGKKDFGGRAVDPEASVARLMVFDANKDGKLSKEEITDERLVALFERADANKDGVATKEELLALITKEAAASPGKKGPDGFEKKGGEKRTFEKKRPDSPEPDKKAPGIPGEKPPVKE